MAPAPYSFRRVYAIGDIHGRSDLLDRMVDLIRHDLQGLSGDECLTVTLGDYFDRGPDSRGVIDRLVRNPFPTHYLGLKGNHEELFEGFLQDPTTGRNWRQLGGLETLHSYGVPVSSLMLGRQFEDASRSLAAKVPREHFEFLAALQPSVNLEHFFLCHAGVRPGVPLEKQRIEDLLWIRNEFLDSPMNFGKIVVHGHTPAEQPEIRPNRINIDTGAFVTGRLTCAVLEGTQWRLLST